MLSRDIIYKNVQQEYNKVVEKYGTKHILGTFVIGLANYGYAEYEDEITYITVYLPSFEEMCINTTQKDPRLYDIRQAYSATKNKCDTSLELLYSDYYIINPDYLSIWDKLIKCREQISKVNKKERLTKVKARAIKAYREMNFFEVSRLYFSAKLYFQGIPCEDCFHIKDVLYKSMLDAVKKDNILKMDFSDILADFDNMILKISPDINYDADKMIKQSIVDFVTASFSQRVSIDAFKDCLTEMELKAFEALQSRIQNGIIQLSISQIIKETNISRPIYKNLLMKMEQSKIAIIENQGVKGTKIQLLV